MKAMPSSHDRTKDADWIDAAGSLEALGELYQRHADDVHALAFRITPRGRRCRRAAGASVGAPRTARLPGSMALRFVAEAGDRPYVPDAHAPEAQTGGPLDDPSLLPHSETGDALDRIALERTATLPVQLRTVFVLKEIEGYTHVEIAELLQISSANSATRLSRAWAILRKELRP
jgi:RNA polymerase sigma-70 factor (ECF subfamily)